MRLTDAIERLQHLHATGALTDAAFADAKAAVLAEHAGATPGAPPALDHNALAVLCNMDQPFRPPL